MPQALDPAAYVFEGIWTNWSKGDAFRGLTLTLAPIRATLLTNSLALFFALSGGQLWTIMRFILHQMHAFAPLEPQTLLRHQEQVVLRNATTDLSTTQLMWSLAWTSRRASKPVSRAVCIGILALFHAVLFMVGGTFSGQLASAGPEVLSRSPHCGVWNLTYYNTAILNGPTPSSKQNMTLSFEARTKDNLDVQLSFEYAQKCYLNQPDQSPGQRIESGQIAASPTCDTLRRPQLSWITTYNGTCPFAVELCHNNAPVLVLDTGDIDSHKDLGINAAPNDRLTYRRVTTCAVLNDTGHLSGWDGYTDSPSQSPSQHTTYAQYGRDLKKLTDETYAYSNYASFYTNFSSSETAPYHLNSFIAYSPNGASASYGDFLAVPELEQDSADLTLLFLSYPGNYLEPIDDPWFSAHHEHYHANMMYPFTQNRYARDHPISTMGCIEQHKFCNPSKGICTPLSGFDSIQYVPAFNESLSPQQNATFDRMTWTVLNSRITDITYSLGLGTGRSLLAMDSTAVGNSVLSLHLPENQWQLEVGYWHSMAMASFQRGMAQWATGQVAADTKYLLPPQLEQDVWFCRNFMVPSSVYQSFSLLAIILMVLFGSLVILLSLTIENWTGWARRRWNKCSVRWQKWTQHDMLNFPLLTEAGDWKPSSPPNSSSSAARRTKQSDSISINEKLSAKMEQEIPSQNHECWTSPVAEPPPPPQYRTLAQFNGLVWSRRLPPQAQGLEGLGQAPAYWI